MLKLPSLSSTQLFGLCIIGTAAVITCGYQLRCSLKKKKKHSLKFIDFNEGPLEKTLVVDCHHTTADQITHHLKLKGQRSLTDTSVLGDTSTQGVINAIKANHRLIYENEFVTTNHFDIDSFLSIWCAVNPELAVEHEALITTISKIGDFRELNLDSDMSYDALRLACWMNSTERKLFWRPFDSVISKEFGEDASKFSYFLRHFSSHVIDMKTLDDKAYQEEYARVLNGYKLLRDEDGKKFLPMKVRQHPSIGLVVVQVDSPMHYYSLFSCSEGMDIVLAMYADRKYEVELKYTTFIDLMSRPTLPRVDMTALANALNKMESDLASQQSLAKHIEPAVNESASLDTSSSTEWLEDYQDESEDLPRKEDSARKLSLKARMESLKLKIKANKAAMTQAAPASPEKEISKFMDQANTEESSWNDENDSLPDAQGRPPLSPKRLQLWVKMQAAKNKIKANKEASVNDSNKISDFPAMDETDLPPAVMSGIRWICNSITGIPCWGYS